MPRSRSTIETEIVALQAELAAAQPDGLTLKTFGGKRVVLKKTKFLSAHLSVFGYGADVSNSDAKLAEGNIAPEHIPALVDWLVYHFPKENA